MHESERERERESASETCTHEDCICTRIFWHLMYESQPTIPASSSVFHVKKLNLT